MIAKLEKTQRTVTLCCHFIFHFEKEHAKIFREQRNSKPKYVLIIKIWYFSVLFVSLINITVILGETYEIVVLIIKL